MNRIVHATLPSRPVASCYQLTPLVLRLFKMKLQTFYRLNTLGDSFPEQQFVNELKKRKVSTFSAHFSLLLSCAHRSFDAHSQNEQLKKMNLGDMLERDLILKIYLTFVLLYLSGRTSCLLILYRIAVISTMLREILESGDESVSRPVYV